MPLLSLCGGQVEAGENLTATEWVGSSEKKGRDAVPGVGNFACVSGPGQNIKVGDPCVKPNSGS